MAFYLYSAHKALWLVQQICGLDPAAFVESKYIVLWASNVITTNIHLWYVIMEARKRGAKLVVIDPVRTRKAKQAVEEVSVQ